MIDSNSDGNQVSSSDNPSIGNAVGDSDGNSLSDRMNDVMGQVNETLGKVDWTQMGKYGKAVGIIAIVIIAQVIIKVIVDTINFFPVLPGLLELLGVVVVGQWSW